MSGDRQQESVQTSAPAGESHVVFDDAAILAAHSLDADFLRTLIEESNRVFFLLDGETKALIYISPAFERIWRIPRQEFIADGRRWFQTLHPDDRDRCMREAEIRLQNPESSLPPFDYRIYWPDGELRWIRGSIFRCRHAATGATLLCGISEDITELKRGELVREEARAELESVVRRRTAELTDANESLQREIQRRAEVENELRTKQAFLEKMLHFQEWERKLVSFEIHDLALQNMVAARMHLDSLATGKLSAAQQKKLGLASDLLRSAVDEARRIINGMRPQTLDVLGLRAAVDELLAQYRSDGLDVALDYRLDGERLSPMIETTLYRLIQESLANVLRHAGVETAAVDVRRENDRLLLRVADTGVGFDPTTVEVEKYGLRGLRERAKAVGGEVTIETAPERGTTVTARLPSLDPLESATSRLDSATAAVHLSRTRLEQIIDNTSAVIFVKDYQGRYELANNKHQSLFHLGRDVILGKTDYDFLPHEVADAVVENDRLAAQSPTPITFEESVPSDGMMRDYVTVKFKIPGEPGRPPSICGIATDITEQKRQLRSLAEARHQFQAFMDHSPILAWIKDAEFRYVFMNRRMLEIFHLDPANVCGRTDFEVFGERWAAPVRAHDEEVLAQGGSHRYREYCPVGAGLPLAWESCKFRLHDSDGAHLIGGVAIDVTGDVPFPGEPTTTK